LVPAPRVHLVRFHGILGPAAAWQPLIVPTANIESATARSNPIASSEFVDAAAAKCTGRKSGVHRRNYSWAQLMRRVFTIDVLQWDRCRGVMRIIAAIHPLTPPGRFWTLSASPVGHPLSRLLSMHPPFTSISSKPPSKIAVSP